MLKLEYRQPPHTSFACLFLLKTIYDDKTKTNHNSNPKKLRENNIEKKSADVAAAGTPTLVC